MLQAELFRVVQNTHYSQVQQVWQFVLWGETPHQRIPHLVNGSYEFSFDNLFTILFFNY